MLPSSKPGKFLTLAAALCAAMGAVPASAECLVEGVAYLSVENGISDPTGPALFIKTSAEGRHYTFVRLRDSRFISETMAGSKGMFVRVLADAPSCPTEGPLRDAGTAVRVPQLIGS